MDDDQPVVFHVTSNFGHRTQQPFVMMTVGEQEFTAQMSPEDARDLAHNLLACADAAESDGFLVGFLQETVGVKDMRAIATILVQFREYREARTK